MDYCRLNDGSYAVHIDRGEGVIASLTRFAVKERIYMARVYGVGGVRDTMLGCFDLERGEYCRRRFPEYRELVSASGSVTLGADGQPFVHLHAAFAGHDFQVIGGHLFETEVAIIGQMFVVPMPGILPIQEIPNCFGLQTWDIARCVSFPSGGREAPAWPDAQSASSQEHHA
ncbi:PPC domain-containing DNA-binding protein [Sorangium sp. So ce1128]